MENKQKVQLEKTEGNAEARKTSEGKRHTLKEKRAPAGLFLFSRFPP